MVARTEGNFCAAAVKSHSAAGYTACLEDHLGLGIGVFRAQYCVARSLVSGPVCIAPDVQSVAHVSLPVE